MVKTNITAAEIQLINNRVTHPLSVSFSKDEVTVDVSVVDTFISFEFCLIDNQLVLIERIYTDENKKKPVKRVLHEFK